MSRGDWARTLALGILFFAPAHLLFYASIGLTSEVDGSVLLSTTPLWTAIISFFFLKGEHMTTKRWVAIFLSFVGAYIVAVGFKFPDMLGHTKGNLMFGSGVIIECVMGVLAAKIIRRTSGISVLVGQMWGGAISFWLAALFLGSSLPLGAELRLASIARRGLEVDRIGALREAVDVAGAARAGRSHSDASEDDIKVAAVIVVGLA